MQRRLIENAVLLLEERTLDNSSVLLEDGKIAEIGTREQMSRKAVDERVNVGGDFLAPGFIDLHIHGTGLHLVDHGPDALAGLCRLLPTYGVTGFLPTVAPRKPGDDARFLASLSSSTPAGAQILGFHLEGPFLSLTGALPKEALGKG